MPDRKNIEALMARIRALRAMTQANGCTEHEAISAALLAARILEENGLSLEDVETLRVQPRVGRSVDEVTFAPATSEIGYCVDAIAHYFDCAVWMSGSSFYTLLGLPQDVFAAQTLLEIVGDAMEISWDDYKTHKRREPIGWRDNSVQHDRIKQAFLGAMGIKIARRLNAIKSAPASTGNGQALVLAKSDIVRRAMQERGIVLEKGEPLKLIDDFHASVAGSSAGDRVDLANPFKVQSHDQEN